MTTDSVKPPYVPPAHPKRLFESVSLEDIPKILPLLSEAEQEQLLLELDKLEEMKTRKAARDKFMPFVRAMWPSFISGRHHAKMAEAFEKVANGEIKRLIINMPPRHTKSEFASYLLPAWFLGKNPGKKVIQTSHTAELAVGFGRKVRNLVDTDAFHDVFPDLVLQSDSKAAGRWNTSKGGDYFAIGVGGAVTGKGADILIIDDPHSEQEAALAEVNPEIYDKTYEWYTSGPRQRLQPGGSIIIVATRWSKRDLVARVLEASAQRGGEDWTVIEFPAILPSGKPLWPEFWPLPELQALKDELPNSKWMAQYQQQPTSDTSAIIKREWWQKWPTDEPPQCDFILQTWDTAFEKTQRSDYSAVTTWGVFYKPDDTGVEQASIILLDAFRERMEFPKLKQKAIDQYKEWQPDSVIIEKKASGAPLIYEMRAMGIPVQEFTPTRGNDKISRLNAVADIFASGRVWAPNTSWAEEVIEEVASFPASQHDDYCFVAGTKIATPYGDRAIETLRAGDEVITPFGVRKVSAAGFTGVRPVVSRAGLTGTGNHPVFVVDTGWMALDTVSMADGLSRLNLCGILKTQHPKQLSLMASLTGEWGVNDVITWPNTELWQRVKALKGFTWLFGSTTPGGKFYRAMRSTIKTTTRLTSTLQTLKNYHAANIAAYLSTSLPRKLSRHIWTIWQGSGLSQRRGISPPKGALGIGKTLSTVSPWLTPLNARKTFSLLNRDLRVRGAVERHSKRTLGASSAVYLAEGSTHGTLPGSASPPTPTSCPVYNLTVEGAHCYYANGILVHNCDTVSMALARFRKGGYITTNLDEPDDIRYFKSHRTQGYY